jgi:hypothetical protein
MPEPGEQPVCDGLWAAPGKGVVRGELTPEARAAWAARMNDRRRQKAARERMIHG